jgi:hypothetical protein
VRVRVQDDASACLRGRWRWILSTISTREAWGLTLGR